MQSSGFGNTATEKPRSFVINNRVTNKLYLQNATIYQIIPLENNELRFDSFEGHDGTLRKQELTQCMQPAISVSFILNKTVEIIPKAKRNE